MGVPAFCLLDEGRRIGVCGNPFEAAVLGIVEMGAESFVAEYVDLDELAEYVEQLEGEGWRIEVLSTARENELAERAQRTSLIIVCGGKRYEMPKDWERMLEDLCTETELSCRVVEKPSSPAR